MMDEQGGETFEQRVARLAKQRAAPTDTVDPLDARIAALQKPAAATPASVGTMTPDQRHAAYRSGTLQQMVKAEDAPAPPEKRSISDFLVGQGVRAAGNWFGAPAMVAAHQLAGDPMAMDYSDVASGGKPHWTPKESWADASNAVRGESEQAGEDVPGVTLPLLGRTTLADLATGGAAFAALKRMGMRGTAKIAATLAGGNRAIRPEEESALSRGAGTVASAATGALLAKGLETAGTQVRAKMAPDAGVQAFALEDPLKAADKTNYGKAEAEAAATPTTPAIQRALQEPDIAPVADAIRAGRNLQNASDSRILLESLKDMSEKQGLLKRTKDVGNRTVVPSREIGNIGAAKGVLREAAGSPSVERIPGQPAIAQEIPEVPELTRDIPAPPPRSLYDMVYKHQSTSLPGEVPASEPITREGTTTMRNPAQPDHTLPPDGNALGDYGRRFRQTFEKYSPVSSEPATEPGGWVQHKVGEIPTGEARTEVVRPFEPARSDILRPAQPPADLRVQAAMPSLDPAMEESARLRGGIDAYNQGLDATSRIMRGTAIKGSKQTKLSAEAFRRALADQGSGDAEQSLQGILSRLNEGGGMFEGDNLAPSRFKATKAFMRAGRMHPYIEQLDAKIGSPEGSLARALERMGVVSYTSSQPDNR